MASTTAVAVFVKTPGLSPLKTRLAEGIGRGAAEEFHRLSAAAVRAVARRAAEQSPLSFYWAVAEGEAVDHPLWRGDATLRQGDGGLGERLANVYDTLIARHPRVVLLGADSPQITPATLIEAAAALGEGAAFALGRTVDGGFYLFGGNGPLPRSVWLDVSYSASETADELARRLRVRGAIHELPLLHDADTADDLPPLLDELASLADPLTEQRAVVDWLRRQV
ncbi:MAG: TIGR04282 family arsenosugar biosynthesis glycosyltransferase [Planctomycetaceae bacterium]